MLDNFKVVLSQHRKFLAIFFVVVFLPSVILAFFGIRAIQNERYKRQQQTLDQQKEFARSVQAEIRTRLERNASSLKELSVSRAFFDRDDRAIRDLISVRLREKSLLGQIVIWYANAPPWLPALQAHPPAAKRVVVPEAWHTWRREVEKAERAEFQRRNYAEAIALYRRIRRNVTDNQVIAWMLNRIARCEVKREHFKEALLLYRSILADYPGLLTESGRPLELVSRLAMLDALRWDKDYEGFFQESMTTYHQIAENVWSLDGDQVRLYATMLKATMDEMAAEWSPGELPDTVAAAVGDIQHVLEMKFESWRMAEAVRLNILPGMGAKVEEVDSDRLQVQKKVFELGEDDIIALLVPLDREDAGQDRAFLGSLIRISDLTAAIEDQVAENRPPGISVLLRSTLSNTIIFGDRELADGAPIITEFFPENFPPWWVEVYQNEAVESGLILVNNIFFWTILALLIILFMGSGLIIHTIIHDVNLLNLKSGFIASVSHEFKTPLTSIGAILEHLQTGDVKDPDKRQQYYRILSHESERLKRLVNNVLDFTKIEEGKRKYKLALIDIVRLVRQEVNHFEEENHLNGLSVGMNHEDPIPPVFADEEAIGQALHNLLDNAAKFSDQETAINVEIIREQDHVEIAVQDRGIGIPENEQKKIFEKFFRGKQASRLSPTGTGLGLTLVKHIMEAHGGEVIVQSRPGEGSRVSLILPDRKGA